MTTPLRLTVVLTHPIQYYAPWFRHIDAHAREIALTVLHATEPSPEQQGVDFGRAFSWDVPLTTGYRCRTVRPSQPGDRIDARSFFGLDVPEIGAAIADTSPDVVVVPGWFSITLVRALMFCRKRRIPVLYRGDTNLDSAPTGWRRPAWSVKSRVLLRQFDGYLSTGTRTREYLSGMAVAPYRIFDVPPAVDNDFFAAAATPHQTDAGRVEARRRLGILPDAFVPLFVGKLVDSKRPLDVVRAAATLDRPSCALFVGAGPLEGAIRDEAARLDQHVALAGFRNQTELGEAYAAADCLVLPSTGQETWGLVVNEALATGLPAIVSDKVGCGPDLIHEGLTGRIFRCGDIAALAGMLESVRRRSAKGHEWSAECRARVGAFTFEKATEGLVRACRSVIRHSTGAEPDWSASSRRIVACCGQMVIPGGLERTTFHALRAARDSGAPAHCIVNSWENFRITPLAEAAGASWSAGPYWYPMTRRRLTPLKIARMIVEVARVSAHLASESWRIDPTHVFLPDYQTVLRNTPGLMWLRLRGATTVLRLGNAPEPGPFYRWLWRWIVNPVVDRFVCNSRFTERELLAHGIPTHKVRTIPNAAFVRPRATRDVDPIRGRVVFAGQIIPEKGLDLLLDAVAQLRRKDLDVTLDVLGDVDAWEAPSYRGFRAGVRARAARPDLAGAVRFLGWRDDVAAVMARAAIHCCPSRPEQREAFGIVVLEAKLAAVPSVVCPSGNLPDLVRHRETGWVCAEASADAIAEGIEYFVRNPEHAAAAGRAAFASAEEYSDDKFTAAWSEVFQVASPSVLTAASHARP